MKERIAEQKFQMALHGAEPADAPQSDFPKPNKDNLLFGDPADYDKMTPAEREEKTQKMMAHWGRWIGSL